MAFAHDGWTGKVRKVPLRPKVRSHDRASQLFGVQRISRNSVQGVSTLTPSNVVDMTTQSQIEEQKRINSAFIIASTADILAQSGGATVFVLVRSAQIAGRFETKALALAAGRKEYPDNLFSVHEVTAKPRRVGGAVLVR